MPKVTCAISDESNEKLKYAVLQKMGSMRRQGELLTAILEKEIDRLMAEME
jgi:hypothetical protein